MSDLRLNKAISETGFCSRREADKYIEKGLVEVNGKKAELGTRVSEKDSITVNGKLIKKEVQPIYLMFNKPRGIICTTDIRIDNNIISYINYPERIFPIGRLDKPSEGLILLTNDGDIVNKILRSKNHHEKEYIVKVDKKIKGHFLKKMSQGVPILDTITRPCKTEIINDFTFKIILTQGLNRQIRRMCEYLGYRVVSLKRIRIMNIQLGNLKVGAYRAINAKEFQTLSKLIAHSEK